jgi:hypothetical protein
VRTPGLPGLGLPGLNQEELDGTLHPNREGQRQIAKFIKAALMGSACVARQPGTILPVAYSTALTAPSAALTCLSPSPVDLPLSHPATVAAASVPAWILIGLGAGAFLLLFVLIARKALPVAIPRFRPRSASGRARLRRPMGMKGWSTTNLVVVCLGAALVVFFAGVTAAVAAGQPPPTALWAAGGAVSGALIGLLVPAPGSKKAHQEAATAATALATEATTEAAAHTEAAAAPGAAEPAAQKVKAKAAEAVAKKASEDASAHNAAAASTPETKAATLVLAVLFLVLLALGVVLASGVTEPSQPFVASVQSLATAVVALASASGTALIGILAPSPGKGS